MGSSFYNMEYIIVKPKEPQKLQDSNISSAVSSSIMSDVAAPAPLPSYSVHIEAIGNSNVIKINPAPQITQTDNGKPIRNINNNSMSVPYDMINQGEVTKTTETKKGTGEEKEVVRNYDSKDNKLKPEDYMEHNRSLFTPKDSINFKKEEAKDDRLDMSMSHNILPSSIQDIKNLMKNDGEQKKALAQKIAELQGKGILPLFISFKGKKTACYYVRDVSCLNELVKTYIRTNQITTTGEQIVLYNKKNEEMVLDKPIKELNIEPLEIFKNYIE